MVTREEVEEIVARHMAQAVAQIGKDLEDKYATKEEVAESIKSFANTLSEAVREETEKWKQEGFRVAKDLAEGRNLPKDNPLSFLVEIVNDVTTLRLRVMELGLLVILTQKKGLVDGSLEKTIRLEAFIQTLLGHQREEVFAEMTKYAGKNPESPENYNKVMQDVREFLGGEA